MRALGFTLLHVNAAVKAASLGYPRILFCVFPKPSGMLLKPSVTFPVTLKFLGTLLRLGGLFHLDPLWPDRTLSKIRNNTIKINDRKDPLYSKKDTHSGNSLLEEKMFSTFTKMTGHLYRH